MAQNEMEAKADLPERVLSNEGLGVLVEDEMRTIASIHVDAEFDGSTSFCAEFADLLREYALFLDGSRAGHKPCERYVALNGTAMTISVSTLSEPPIPYVDVLADSGKAVFVQSAVQGLAK